LVSLASAHRKGGLVVWLLQLLACLPASPGFPISSIHTTSDQHYLLLKKKKKKYSSSGLERRLIDYSIVFGWVKKVGGTSEQSM
jgi:hypothetical protein